MGQLKDDGDIVRAYGFLSIYWGNLEDAVHEVFETAADVWPDLQKHAHLRFSDKVEHLSRELARQFTNSPDFKDKKSLEEKMREVLKACQSFAQERNALSHGSIIAPQGTQVVLKSRKNGDREINSKEVYDLANQVLELFAGIKYLGMTVDKLSAALKPKLPPAGA